MNTLVKTDTIYRTIFISICAVISLVPMSFSHAEESAPLVDKIPADLMEKVLFEFDQKQMVFGDKETSRELAENVASSMYLAMKTLQPLIEADAGKEEKQYELSASMASFLFLMETAASHGLSKGVSKAKSKDFMEILSILKKHNLIIDHPLSALMLDVIDYSEFYQEGHEIKVVMYTKSGKKEKIKFDDKILAPRFVISGMSVENEASFTFSKLLAPANAKELEAIKKDSQKSIIKMVLMDEFKENVPSYLDNYDSNDPIQPMLLKAKGLGGKGTLKGIRIPTPEIQMETLFLLPGRQGSPIFSRSKAAFVKPLVAL